MRLIRYQLLFVSLFVFFSSSIHAQDVDEIIDKHIQAHGGAENWDAIKSMKITAKFTAFSEEADFMSIKTNAGAYYSDLHLGQFQVQEGFNGKNGWTVDPWHEFLFPRELNKTEVNVFYQKADFFTPFYRYKEKGLEVELLEDQNVDGIDLYVIKISRPNGKWETWYLNKETYLEYKSESFWVDFTFPAAAESYFDDFRTIEGVVIPYFVERTFFQRDRILMIENIEFNVDYDQQLFEMPKSEEIKKLAFLEGEWDVKVEIVSRRGGWIEMDNTTSSIHFETTNMLLEKISYDQMFVQDNRINYYYDAASENYKLSIYNSFSSDMSIFEGSFSDTLFVAENLSFGCPDTTQKMVYAKIIIGSIKDDSFVIETKNSYDNAATWRSATKLTYVRREE